jgi:hypothetical protein
LCEVNLPPGAFDCEIWKLSLPIGRIGDTREGGTKAMGRVSSTWASLEYDSPDAQGTAKMHNIAP